MKTDIQKKKNKAKETEIGTGRPKILERRDTRCTDREDHPKRKVSGWVRSLRKER